MDRGAGTAGIAAAQALSNQSISDFIIVEYNGNIGGRMKTFEFGEKPDGSGPYTLELGANWIQGLGSPGGPVNPVWTLVRITFLTSLTSILTNSSGSKMELNI